ncbi:MAG: CDP-3,6-dideoxy-D-glycero-L-glycero-4-hexulose-4-reductase [Pirellula sp.]|nr:CDP-3,6-dideoxy-D-glycero-L-glycero-4-hexulose-4-reductase [Pirellula sp.]
MTKLISIHSFRGGTGKSNTTANLAVMIAKTGRRVAIIDTDIQSPGVHVLFSLDPSRVTYTLNDYLWSKCKIEEAAYDVTDSVVGNADESGRTRLFLVPSAIDTGAIAKILREGYDVGMLNDGLHELADRLKLDVLLIDTHPGVNEETLLSIAISDLLLLIMRPDNQDFQGTAVTAELARRLDVKKMLLMVNKVPPSMDREALRQKVEDLYGVEVAGILPLNEEIVNVASGAIFTNRYPQHPFTRCLVQVVDRVLQCLA